MCFAVACANLRYRMTGTWQSVGALVIFPVTMLGAKLRRGLGGDRGDPRARGQRLVGSARRRWSVSPPPHCWLRLVIAPDPATGQRRGPAARRAGGPGARPPPDRGSAPVPARPVRAAPDQHLVQIGEVVARVGPRHAAGMATSPSVPRHDQRWPRRGPARRASPPNGRPCAGPAPGARRSTVRTGGGTNAIRHRSRPATTWPGPAAWVPVGSVQSAPVTVSAPSAQLSSRVASSNSSRGDTAHRRSAAS